MSFLEPIVTSGVDVRGALCLSFPSAHSTLRLNNYQMHGVACTEEQGDKAAISVHVPVHPNMIFASWSACCEGSDCCNKVPYTE